MFDDPRSDDSRERDDDPRDLDGRDREPGDPRDVFMREMDLPRSDVRHRVHDRDREYSLRESETRTLATAGAFRVVSSRDLSDIMAAKLIRTLVTCGISAKKVSSVQYRWREVGT